jgi:nitroreductase
MEVYEAIRRRYSVRGYKDKDVPQDVLDRILETAILAPTGKNRQSMKIVVVRDAQMRRSLAKASGQAFMAKAPVTLAVVGLTPESMMFCNVPADPVDCAIAIDHMTLAAVSEGLGTCWIGHFDQDACRELLGVPETMKIIELLTLGYPDISPHEKKRKSFGEIVCMEKFQ